MGTQQKESGMAIGELTRVRAESASAPSLPVGLYVHVPFCTSTCDFCAFYQVRPDASKIALYLEGISKERDLVAWTRPISTLFWGGGTPGLLSPGQIRQMGEILRPLPGVVGVKEWSVEMAPASVTEARLEALREIGVTRISMGVQSFRPDLLEALGRQHTREQVFRAYERVKQAGFASVNLDLMFALPGQDESAWLDDLQQAIDLGPDHLSTYCLTFEEDTALWVKLSQGKVKLDPEREAHLYRTTWSHLEAAGYPQYEVSNFARPGHACVHNVNTWRMGEWVGLGPSAASQFDGFRGTNVADLAEWSAGVAQGARATEERIPLTPQLMLEDGLIFGLRMNEGVDLVAWRRRVPQGPWDAVERIAQRLVADGLAVFEEPILRLTDPGRLLADAVGGEIMDVLWDAAVPGRRS